MAHKLDGMKAVPIKNYNFQVDFKVNETDVLEKFLDPQENKYISIPKRPTTAKKSTWGTPKSPVKKFETSKPQGINLAIKGTANPDLENQDNDNPIATNIFTLKAIYL